MSEVNGHPLVKVIFRNKDLIPWMVMDKQVLPRWRLLV